MVRVGEMTDEEQLKMYMKCSKKELCKMLIQANKHLGKMMTIREVDCNLREKRKRLRREDKIPQIISTNEN